MNNEQLIIEIEKAAMSLLTDDEIQTSLSLSDEVFAEHYHIVEKTRITLKQRLNAKRITEAAKDGNTESILDQIPRTKRKFGGPGLGQGRPKGTLNKMSGASILKAIEAKTGDTFENLLADGYKEAIDTRDKNLRIQYEKLFLNKVVSDRVEVAYAELSTEDVKARYDALLAKATRNGNSSEEATDL